MGQIPLASSAGQVQRGGRPALARCRGGQRARSFCRLFRAGPVIRIGGACEGAASPRAGIFPPRAVNSAHRVRPASFRPGERTSATEEVVMPDRHSGLPAHPDLEYYRKQAKHLLRSYEAGDAAARDRAAEVLGDRAAGRFLLSDAQFVLAQEHGFRTWAEFRADIQNQRTAGDRPVSPLWGGSSGYASQADSLLTELRRGDPDALQRLRAQVPRYAAATGASTAELRDARLVIAREAGFPTWRELVASAERSQRDEAEREENWRRMRPEAEALLAGDTARLAQLTAG